MDCPQCATPVAEEAYEGVPIAECSRCRGIWLEGEHFLAILERRDRAFADADVFDVLRREENPSPPAAPRPRRLRCPRCFGFLVESLHEYSTRLAVDRCPKGCGLYLDEGELDHLQILVEKIEEQAQDYVLKHGISTPSGELVKQVEAFGRQASLWHRVLGAVVASMRRRLLRDEPRG